MMDQYEIWCTPERTKKALELGAPLKVVDSSSRKFTQAVRNLKSLTGRYTFIDNFQQPGEYWCKMIHIPTAGWMTGWLEGQYHIHVEPEYSLTNQNYDFCILDENKPIGEKRTMFNEDFGLPSYSSRKEAILAAIDAALEYLSNKK